jgi:hypothetical protein
MSLTATHIEVEWATIVLNLRQGLSYAALFVGVVAIGRLAYHVLLVAVGPAYRIGSGARRM